MVLGGKSILLLWARITQQYGDTIEMLHHRAFSNDMIGCIGIAQADSFIDLPRYKPYLGPLVTQYVLPELVSPHGFLRFTGCHVISNFARVQFTAEENHAIIDSILKCLADPELPVRVQAAVRLLRCIYVWPATPVFEGARTVQYPCGATIVT